MTHRYTQRTGEWHGPARDLMGVGYAGWDDGDGVVEPGEGKNDPSKQTERGIGPVPVGDYVIGRPFNHPTIGEFVMRLEPMDGTETFGRSGFLIHGGNPKGGSSQGCIVLPRLVRERIWQTGDRHLRVVAEPSAPAVPGWRDAGATT